jgi:DNA polymerase
MIQPKVVVTLGNFATKLLLQTKDGITKLRGRTYPFRTGVLIPTFHPAAVLRGGGEPLAQMRADFIRAKQALVAA